MLRGARAATPVRGGETRSLPGQGRGLLATLIRVGRSLLVQPREIGSAPADVGPADVTLPLPLTPREAELGGERRVTLDSRPGREHVRVTIPAGTRPGTRLRLRGKGRPRPDGSRGDAYLAVEIVEPS